MRELDVSLGRTVLLQMSSRHAVEESLPDADLVIGGVLVHGAKAPHLVTRDMLGSMKPGSVLVDVAIDQGGCFETSRPTTHSDPTYVVDGIVHYCVANMPGAVPITSTWGAHERHAAVHRGDRREGPPARAGRRPGARARASTWPTAGSPASPSPRRSAWSTRRSSQVLPLQAA